MIWKFATPTPRPAEINHRFGMPSLTPKPRIDTVKADTYAEAVAKICARWRKEGICA